MTFEFTGADSQRWKGGPPAIREGLDHAHLLVREQCCKLLDELLVPDAVAALNRARADDPSPLVRKKAGWHTPGGPVHRRTAPRPTRAARR